MENTVYIVFEEKNWKNCEYCDVVSVHKTKEKAVERLAECKQEFLNDYKEEIANIRDNEYPHHEADKEDFYLFIDEGMGYNYELSIKVMDLD